MDISTETLGLTHGVGSSLEDADELLTEVSEKAEDIMERAYAEFNSFLKKKGLRNSMGMLTPKDGTKVLYHITDIEWDLDDEDDTNAESNNLPKNVDVQDINGTVSNYLFDTYCYLVKSYKVSVEIIDESEDSRYEKFKTALWNAGTDTIENFCDVTFSGYENDAIIDALIDDVIAQMPDDVFDKYYKQYVKEDYSND